jgi:hypothetical protein
VNELEIIRSQLLAEQAHAAEVANACAAVLESTGSSALDAGQAQFREACVGYLAWVLARFEERDQTLSDLLAARPPATEGPAAAGARQLGELLGQAGTSREALSRLESALAASGSQAAGAAWREFARFFNGAWAPRRAALEQALAQYCSVAQLRTVCAIDADSILDERQRYAGVSAQRPAGFEPPGAPAARPS